MPLSLYKKLFNPNKERHTHLTRQADYFHSMRGKRVCL